MLRAATTTATAKAALIYRRRRRRRRLIRLYFGTGKRTHAFSFLHRRKKIECRSGIRETREAYDRFSLRFDDKKKVPSLLRNVPPTRHIANAKHESVLNERATRLILRYANDRCSVLRPKHDYYYYTGTNGFWGGVEDGCFGNHN